MWRRSSPATIIQSRRNIQSAAIVSTGMRHALRRLLKTPGFSATAALTLGLAIGANALIFSVVNGVLLKPLPFVEPERLVGVWHVAPGVAPGPLNQAPSTYFTYREHGQVFEDIGLWTTGSVTVTGRGDPVQTESLTVTDGTLPLLRVHPTLGRTFSKEDGVPGGPDTVMLSHAYWQSAFASNTSAIGQQLIVNGRPHEVIGVLPESFRFLRYNPSVVLSHRFNRAQIVLGQFSYQGVARLKPGVTIEQANADVARLLATLLDRFPLPPGFSRTMFEEARLGPLVRPFAVDVIGDIGPMLWVLLGTVGIVLLVACANVANLFLVRAEGRQQELAVRVALGAGFRRVARELLTESVALGLIGGLLGIALAFGGIRLLVYLQPARLPRLSEITLDPIVMLFTLTLSVVAGLLFGLIPVLKYARPQLANALKDSSRGSSEGRERHRARNTLVIAQVALAVILLVGSGLMIRTFMAMRNVPPGFVRPDDVFTMRISIPAGAIKDDEQALRAHQEIIQRLKDVQGVQSVGVSSSITMDGNSSNDPIFVEDFPRNDGKLPPLRRFKWIGEGYFETMGNPVIAGRAIDWADITNISPVAMVSDNLAREYWGEPAKAIGRRIRQTPRHPWREIIGVVGNEVQDGITQPIPSIVYWPARMRDSSDSPPYTQRGFAYVIRTARLQDPAFMAEVQKAVWSVNPNLPIARPRTLREIYDGSMAQTSFTLVILGIAAAVSLLLGTVGIYGVIAYVVSQRRREIGIRVALGARAAEVQRMFITRGLTVTGAGLILGGVGAIGVMRFLRTLLFEVSPMDPITYAVVIAGLGAVALVATWLPARAATRVDPATALRGD
jgi:putative ABC transport system permease protein